jgi:peptide/nickel transport system substrate-binding protein
MTPNYWSRILEHSLGRRRVLATTGAGALGAAFLAACGGNGTTTTPSGDRSGLLTPPRDTTSQAKAGGAIRHWADGDATNFDGTASNANGVINWISAFAYPRMIRFEPPKHSDDYDGAISGELADSFELSADKLTLTFKVRQGMKWDARAPTNGRFIDAQDVMYSWNKFVQLNPSGANLAAARSPAAPIESVTAPDNRTIVMKMNQPDSSILPLFGSWDHFYISPREAESQFNPRDTVRGHGPWILEEYTPSTRFVWAKNPDYYLRGRPYADRLERPIVPEYASRLAQFRTGSIITHTANPTDILQTKKDTPATQIFQDGIYSASIWNGLSFGYEGGSPFKDQRVRQAASMLIDRDAYSYVLDSADIFTAEGIDMQTAYNTVVARGWGDFWLDPKDTKNFGPNAKFLTQNIEEAKKLLAAAGFPNGFEYDMFHSTTLYGAPYLKSVELLTGMMEDGGLRGVQRGYAYQQFKDIYYEAYYGPSFESGKTKGFNGMVHLANPAAPTVASHLFTFVHKDGGRFHGMTPNGQNAHLGDTKLNSDIEKLRVEFDRDKQVSLTHDIVRYFTGQSYYIPRPAHVKQLTLVWPALSNYQTYNRTPSDNQWAEANLQWWVDQTKPPFA